MAKITYRGLKGRSISDMLRRILARHYMKNPVAFVTGILFCPAETAGCDLATNGLVGWWKGEHDALESSGYSNHGVLLGEIGYSNGVVGAGFSFLGTDLVDGDDSVGLSGMNAIPLLFRSGRIRRRHSHGRRRRQACRCH